MNKQYLLKHEDTIGAIVIIEDFSYISGIKIINERALPLKNIYNGKSAEENIKKWIYDRGVPAKRKRLRDELNIMKCNSSFELMLKNYGLSLVDHFWICPLDENLSWAQVNFYENNFRAALTLEIKDDFLTLNGNINFIPSASLKGDLKKKWIIGEDNNRYLVKGNYNNTCRQSISEVIASEIHKRQGKFEYTPYEYIKVYSDGNPIIGCKCKNFTSIDTEFIPAIEIYNSVKKPNSISDIEHYIRVCTMYNINEAYIRDWIDYCILTNFVITNSDWHLNNFGIIVDSATRTHGRPAPIFDSGNSMFYNKTGNEIKVADGLLNIPVTSWTEFEIQMLKYVKNVNIVDLSRLPSVNEILAELSIDKAVSHDDNVRIVRAYTKKIELLQELQSGVEIYKYDYLKKHGIKLKSTKGIILG